MTGLHPEGEGFGVSPAAAEPTEDVLDFSRYLNGLRRRWPLILICVLLAGTVALLRYSLTPKEYRATTTIQIERKRLSILALGQASWLEDWWNQEYYPTQYRLLRSRGMAERVVQNLRLHEDPTFTGREARLLPQEETVATRLDDAAALARLAERLRGGFSVSPIEDTQLVVLTYVSTSPELATRVVNGYAEAFIEWGIETRTSTVGKASDYLTAQIRSLREEIDEGQLELNAYTVDRDIALDPAGEALVERRRKLEGQYNEVVAERISREVAYRQLHNMSEATIAVTDTRVRNLEEELFQLESGYQENLETYRPEWPDMVELEGRITERREQLQQERRLAADRVRDQKYAEYQQALREEDSINVELRKLASEARQYNSSALEYRNLVTRIETRKDLLNELLKRQSQTEVAARVQPSQESNVRIVDTAVVPGEPFRPLLKKDLLRALLLGLLLGVGAVVTLEYFDRTIKTPEELENLLGLPNLAVIPDIAEARGPRRRLKYGQGYGYGYGYSYGYGYGSRLGRSRKERVVSARRSEPEPAAEKVIELLPHLSSRLAICEAYRSLRTALLLSSAQALKLVAVTSAEPGEGKTATTVNLAIVMAQLGRRVLILDGDLRRPRMHKVLKVSNRYGLVHFLTGQAEVDRVVLETEVPNLWVCPSGPIPPNPSELLSAEPMSQILKFGRDHFDMVLIDTPPVLPVADAVIVGTQVDGVVLCACAGVLLRDDARLCRARLQYQEIRILGTILNRFRTQPGRYARRYRYYGLYEEPQAPVEESQSAA